MGAGVVVREDALVGPALLGQAIGAPLRHAHAVAVPATGEPRHPAVERDGEERGPDGLVSDHAPEVVAAELHRAARAADSQRRDTERGRALRDLDGGDAPDLLTVSAENLGQLGEAEVEGPVEVGRGHRVLIADRPQRGHVSRPEHRARVLRVAAARGVIEGREQLAVPEEHLTGGVAHRGPERRRRRHHAGVHLVARRGDDVVGLGAVQRAMVGGIGPRGDRLRTERLARPSVAGLGAQDADEIVLEAQHVHDRETLTVPDHLDDRRVLAPDHPERGVAGQAKALGPASVDLDALAVQGRPHGVGAPGAPLTRRAAELAHLDFDSANLRRSRALDDGDTDRVVRRRDRRARERHQSGRREQAAHRRPTI